MKYVLINSVDAFARILYFLVLIRVLLSWIPVRRDGNFVKILYALTEPILAPIRALINKSPLGGPGMMLDFSPIIAWILIDLIKNLLIRLIHSF